MNLLDASSDHVLLDVLNDCSEYRFVSVGFDQFMIARKDEGNLLQFALLGVE